MAYDWEHHCESNFEKVKKFIPNISITTRYTEDYYYIYFGVVLRDGTIDVTKFPSGRISFRDNLLPNEVFLCFKKITKQNGEVIFQLRNDMLTESKISIIENNPLNMKMFTYLKNHCPEDE
jgi:hypothetical protein